MERPLIPSWDAPNILTTVFSVSNQKLHFSVSNQKLHYTYQVLIKVEWNKPAKMLKPIKKHGWSQKNSTQHMSH